MARVLPDTVSQPATVSTTSQTWMEVKWTGRSNWGRWRLSVSVCLSVWVCSENTLRKTNWQICWSLGLLATGEHSPGWLTCQWTALTHQRKGKPMQIVHLPAGWRCLHAHLTPLPPFIHSSLNCRQSFPCDSRSRRTAERMRSMTNHWEIDGAEWAAHCILDHHPPWIAQNKHSIQLVTERMDKACASVPCLLSAGAVCN